MKWVRPDTFNAWINMKQRCHNQKNPRYKDYGARGISVSDIWLNDYKAFARDVGERPTKHHSLDRIDNDKGYEPGNVRWATRSEQSSNRRKFMVSQRRYAFNGKMLTIPAIAKETGISPSTIYKRLEHEWPETKAFSTPPDQKFNSSGSGF